MTSPAGTSASNENAAAGAWRLIIHGGAGIIDRGQIAPDEEHSIRDALGRALATGAAILDRGGAALDAVAAAACELEEDPHFNAGVGAVFNHEGSHELDAAVMDGATRQAGAVAGATTTRSPVALARTIMERSQHVMLSGAGADLFAREQGLEQVPNSFFDVPERRRQWQEFLTRPYEDSFDIDLKYGTVGAVALDRHGHVAAATSTGGLTGKRWGRIGDSPLIGAGTYADDRAAAVSATGAGEFFIREGVAHEICARIRFLGESAQAAADTVMAEMGALGGTGGVIVVTPRGESVFSFNSSGMYRGESSPAGRKVAIYGDE
jgi:L-asparaginase / beta-aspartyl-peptidase